MIKGFLTRLLLLVTVFSLTPMLWAKVHLEYGSRGDCRSKGGFGCEFKGDIGGGGTLHGGGENIKIGQVMTAEELCLVLKIECREGAVPLKVKTLLGLTPDELHNILGLTKEILREAEL